jgi:alkylation response protein AidB-like acyl-CoA dehydrogenase
MTFQDFTILLEEIGRNILPGPFICTVIEGAYPIMDAGTEAQKKEFLPKIANGESIFVMAQLEPNGLFDASGVTLKATHKGDHYVLEGTKVFVEMANVANYVLCVARTDKGASAEDGVTVFIVDTKRHGVHIEVMPTIGMDKLCEVQFKNVTVPQKHVLGKPDKGWNIVENVMRRGAIAKCAESVGGMQAAVDMTVAYSKERVQYDRPIGAFQALQHIMADVWTAMQTSRYIVYQAAWMESEGMPCTKEVAMAKAYVNEKYKWVTERGVLLHGAIGTSREHDIPLYFRRAKSADIRYGGTDFQRDIVANKIGLVS